MPIAAGAEMQVNTYTSGWQNYQRVTALTGGGWVVTWVSDGQDGFGDGVYQQAYGADASLLGGETRVNTYITEDQFDPQITALSDGGWVVTWISNGQDESGYGVYQQAYNANGSLLGTETRVNTYTSSDQRYQQVTTLAGGGWVVTWVSDGQDGFGYGVYQQAYNADGSLRGGETRVNTYTTEDQSAPQITALAGGGWVVTWQSRDQDGSDWGIYKQAYNADRSLLGGETRVNTYTSGDQDAPGDQEKPQVTALADGGWVITWQSNGQDTGVYGYGVYQQAYNADGSLRGGETLVNTNTSDHQINPRITALAGGGWVVTWESHGQDGHVYGVYLQAYNADGSRLGSEKQANTYTSGQQYYHQVTALAGGGWVVTWESDGEDGSGYSVCQRAYNADGSVLGGEMRVNVHTSDSQVDPAITALADGGWVVAWQSSGQDGSGYGVYQRVFHIDDGGPQISVSDPGLTGGKVFEDGIGGASQVGYAVQVTDPDAGQSGFTVSSAQTRYGTVSLVGGTGGGATVTGQVTYTLNSSLSAVQQLALGQILTDTFTLTTVDGTSRTFTVTIHGADGAPINGTPGNDTHLVGTFEKETIDGKGGNDVISGNLQDDRLIGGTGNDEYELGAYVPSSISDSSGIDTITSTITRSLGAYAAIENLTLLGSAAVNGVGNVLANVLTGNAAANALSGGDGNDTLIGGGGADKMYGGAGNDTYVLYADTADGVSDASGFDTITSTVTRSLAGYAGIENLWLLGSTAISGTGNGLNNLLTGNAAANTLQGGLGNDILNGGGGADTMNGGGGDDTFNVDNASDVIQEAAGGGRDTVLTALTYRLGASAEIETFATTNQAGTTAINLTGNEFGQRINGNNGNNIIYGGAGNDLLVGYGGSDNIEGQAGSDTLKGVSGVDRFVFRQSTVATAGADHIGDFGADDFIYFDHPSVTGPLNPAAFVVGANALDANDRFIYYAPYKALYFDPDGNGAAAKVLFAVFDNGYTPTAADIVLF